MIVDSSKLSRDLIEKEKKHIFYSKHILIKPNCQIPTLKLIDIEVKVINRPGVDGAVLQTPSSLII